MIDSEQMAINRIRRLLFFDKLEMPIKRGNKTFDELNDNIFIKNFYLYTNDIRNFYGLDKKDFGNVLNLIRKAKKNKETTFPDFIYKAGLIEHFKVTASKETGKGSAEIIEQKKFEKSIELDKKQFIEYCNNNPSFTKVRSKSWDRIGVSYSYENLVKSIKKNWEKHIESLNNYKHNKETKIFLIDNCEFALEMIEDMYKNCPGEIRIDYCRKPEHFYNYRLSRDKQLLNYFYQFKNKVDFIIFYYEESFEIIKLKNIPYLLQQLPWDYMIMPRNVIITERIDNISVSIN